MSDDRTLTVLLTADQVRERVRELAAEINRSYPVGRDTHLVSVLKGGFIFLADLVRALDRPVTIDFVAVASYGAGTRVVWCHHADQRSRDRHRGPRRVDRRGYRGHRPDPVMAP